MSILCGTLEHNVERLLTTVAYYHFHTKEKTDKELGVSLDTYPAEISHMLFPLRKHGEPKVRAMALKAIRPTNNRLDGYEPSNAMHRVWKETA